MSEPTLIANANNPGTGLNGRPEEGNKRSRWFSHMASLRLTTFVLLMLGVGGFAASKQLPESQWLVIGPLLLLSVNLVAALISNPRLRVQPALFGMHIGLLLLALSLAYGHMSRFRGHLEISEGQYFDPGQIIEDRKGYLPARLPMEAAFEQGAISVNYAPGVMRRETQSHVVLANGQTVEATDGRPLIIEGYRFYVTHNKGFAALISWLPAAGSQGHMGTLHFPSYPRLAPTQTQSWTAPDGTSLKFTISPTSYSSEEHWTLNRQMSSEQLNVAYEGAVTALQPGDIMNLSGGALRFEGINMWIGYRIFYDPSLYWCFAAAMIAVCCLVLHVTGRHLKYPIKKLMIPISHKVRR